MKSAKIALIGDLHGAWDDWDAHYFDQSDYDCLFFTGDLGSGTGAAGVQVARSIARLGKPVFLMPGNNDWSTSSTKRFVDSLKLVTP